MEKKTGDRLLKNIFDWPRTYYNVGSAVLLCAAVWTAHAQSPRPETKASVQGIEEARRIFAGTCAGCHGLDGRGGERGPNIASRQEIQRRSDEELLQTLRNGISETGMPNFAALGDARLRSLVGYLRILQGKSGPVPIPGDPKRGESAFFGPAGCSECHMIHGKGGFIGADLSVYAADSSPDEVRRAIVSPDADSRENRGLVRVTMLDGKVWEGVLRNEDNFSLQLQSLDGAFHLIQRQEVASVKPSGRPLMPDNYGQTLSAAQIDDLIGYLMSEARSGAEKAGKKKQHEDD